MGAFAGWLNHPAHALYHHCRKTCDVHARNITAQVALCQYTPSEGNRLLGVGVLAPFGYLEAAGSIHGF
jgi:hypothetical protein